MTCFIGINTSNSIEYWLFWLGLFTEKEEAPVSSSPTATFVTASYCCSSDVTLLWEGHFGEVVDE
jgi:hypothetical protein